MNKLHNLKYLFFIVLPIIAIAVWYSPVVFKGYSPMVMSEQIIFGRNLAETGKYAIENDLNVFLAPGRIGQEAHVSSMGNKMTGYLYNGVFKIFGFLSWNNLILFSIILYSLALLIFAFLIYYLFNFKTSIIFSLVYIFLPFNWWRTHITGGYEFALFFLSLFFLLYFLAGDRKKYGPLMFILSGIFLALAGMAREAFMVFMPIFLIYLLASRKKKEILPVFIPLFIMLSIFYLPDFLSGRNSYSQILPVKSPAEYKSDDFIFYGEFYPDPYTYHFNKEGFFNERLSAKTSQGYVSSLYKQKPAVNVNAGQIKFFDRIALGFFLFAGHLARFISLEEVGGPLIFLLMLLGFYVLRKNKPELSKFFIFYIFGMLFLFSFVFLAGRNHLVDFNWVVAILVSLGLLSAAEIIKEYFQIENKKKIFFIAFLILAAVFYNFILSSHVYWGRAYDSKNNLLVMAYNLRIKDINISPVDVIALGSEGFFNAISLNYLSSKSIAVFNPETIDKLLKNGKIKDAFDKFEVKYIVGYPEKMSEEIVRNTGVINISSDNIKLEIQETSFLKSWLMNLIK